MKLRLLFTCVILFTLTSCTPNIIENNPANKETISSDYVSSQPETTSSSQKNSLNNIEIVFSDLDKDVILDLKLPNKWTVRIRESTQEEWTKYPLVDLQLIHNIYNDNNKCVGALGYSTYTKQKGAEELPQAIYSGIALPNNYNFNAQSVEKDGYYIPICNTKNGVTAITKVYYAPNISKDVGYGGKEIYNKGILSYNEDLLFYVAIEFDDNFLTDEELKVIASSIVIE